MAITPVNFAQLSQNQSAGGNMPPVNPPAWTPKPTLMSNIGGAINSAVIQPIKNSITSGVQQMQQGFQQTQQAQKQGGVGGFVSGLEGGAGEVAGAINTISSPLAPIFSIISTALQGNPNKPNIMSDIVNNPAVQKFAMSQSGQTTSRVAQDVQNVSTLAGAGAGIAAMTAKVATPAPTETVTPPTGSSSYDTNLANATAANNQAGVNAVNAAKEASGTMIDTKSDLGTQFSQAPKAIMATDPTASIDLSPSTLDKLNALKDTKTFALPDYLRPTSENFGNGSIDISKIGTGDSSGIKLNPAQAQDLITQLDALTYKAKASGDLAINQQTIGLVNDLKTQAQSAFGHVTDAQGNSVWNSAYQNYRQGMNAVNAMGDLVNIPHSPGEMTSPLDTNKTIGTILKLQETPQGRAILQQSIQQFKNISGYDLTDPIGTIGKLSESNDAYAQALKGNYGHQFIQGLKNPTLASRRVVFAVTSILGLTALGTAFRKQIGGLLTGQ
jgi:hypothetical protein